VPSNRVLGTPPTTTSGGTPAKLYVKVSQQGIQTDSSNTTKLIAPKTETAMVNLTMSPVDGSTFNMTAGIIRTMTVGGVSVTCNATQLITALKTN
jgi:hypothetical protein